MKGKGHEIDTEKTLDKTQHPFIIKTLNKLGMEWKYFNIIDAYSNHYTQWWKKVFPLWWGEKQWYLLPLLLFT